MLSIRFRSVDTTYASREFATDGTISRGVIRDKELTPWDGADGSVEDLPTMAMGLGSVSTGKEKEIIIGSGLTMFFAFIIKGERMGS